MFIGFIGLAIILIVLIRYEIGKINNKKVINIVLSKLDFCPNHYKIIREDNKIYIKCHYYSNDYSHLLFNKYNDNTTSNIIKENNEGYYINFEKTNKRLINYNPKKNINIIVYDILIDIKYKNYKIITSYFQIINCHIDNDNLYSKLIKKLEDPSYYIQINNIYDNNLNFIYKYDEALFEPLNYKFNKSHHLYNPNMEFYITIKNGSDLINIYPILSEINSYKNSNLKLSKYINTRPHINNSSYIINKISGSFI
jgi:hypothetical protein